MAGKQKRNDSPPTLGGRPVIPILEVKKGERIAGIWSSDSVPGIGFYKLLAKCKQDGTCEWVHYVQRSNGDKDNFIRGSVENEARLAEVVEAIDRALHKAYGSGISLHPAEADIYLTDQAQASAPRKPPDLIQ